MLNKIITKDNSETFYNPEFGESYHSTSGAVEESIEKFAKPAKVQDLAARGSVTILDICFGLGYNSAAAIDMILEKNPHCKILVIGLENDLRILAKTQDVNPGFKCYNIIKRVAQDMYYKGGNVEIKILLGDAKETIKQIDAVKFDIVFLDPFSPKKCSELWTAEFMKNIFSLMKSGARLTTYSCASIVRKNLSNAGFQVIEGPCIGRRSPSLIAKKLI